MIESAAECLLMKLLIITDHPDPAMTDASQVFRHIGHELQKRGHAVDYYVEPAQPSHRAFLPAELRQAIRIAAHTRHVCRIKRYDIIIAPGLSGWCLAAFRKWLLPRKTKLASWHAGYQEAYWKPIKDNRLSPFTQQILYIANRQCIKRQDACILTSTGQQDWVRQHYPTESRKALYLPHGVSTRFYYPERYEAEAKPSANRLLVNGHWRQPGTNASCIVEAYGKAWANHPALTLTLINTGLPAEAVLNDFPEDIRHTVQIIPQTDEEERILAYQTHDMLLSPNLAQSSALPVLEAMASGMAVLTSPCDIQRDILRHFENGFILADNTPEALREAISQLYSTPELCRQLGEAAYETASLYYTWRQVTDIFEEKLFQILRNKLPLPDWMMASATVPLSSR